MNRTYGRDLDLNLLRVFAVVAEERSVTAAAARLYITQPAVSAALKRLGDAIGSPVFSRVGRGLALTPRGERLLSEVRQHLDALVTAALSPTGFEPKTSTRTFRLGLSDAASSLLLPGLLRVLEREGPRMRIVAVPVQFRTVGESLASGRIDLAVTVADDIPASINRLPLYHGKFVCLFDPRYMRFPRTPTRGQYLAADHVIVSYNGDLRGIVEDVHGVERNVRCSVAGFELVAEIVDGSALVATIPSVIAEHIRKDRKHLKTAPLPFPLPAAPIELLWRKALDNDDATRFLRAQLTKLARTMSKPPPRRESQAVPA